MKGKLVPLHDHVVRYISLKHLDSSPDGSLRVMRSGFVPRPTELGKVSCHWLEIFGDVEDESIQRIREVSRLRLRKSGKFAMLNVGEMLVSVSRCVDSCSDLSVLSDPLDRDENWPPDPSHAVISNVPDEKDPQCDAVGDAIAITVLKLHPAVNKQTID